MQCAHCGTHNCIEAHHVTKRSNGGGDKEDNVMPLCVWHHANWHPPGGGMGFEFVLGSKGILDWLKKHGRNDIIAKAEELQKNGDRQDRRFGN